MPYRRTIFKKGYYYHIYNRGVNGQRIFMEAENYYFLLRKMKKYFFRDLISVIAYCLMPNHYHFLLRQDSPRSISKSMQSIFNSYSKAFNRRYNRSGTLFEDRFKSVLIDKEEYLVHLCRYIHRNPVDCDVPLVMTPESWPYSNYLEWIDCRNGDLVDRGFIHSYFPDCKQYQEFLSEYVPPRELRNQLTVYFLDYER